MLTSTVAAIARQLKSRVTGATVRITADTALFTATVVHVTTACEMQNNNIIGLL